MSFAEKLLHCVDCKINFHFTVEEQEFHASRGFPNAPERCPACRKKRKAAHLNYQHTDEDNSSSRQMFPVSCTQCGKATRVPFQPRQNEAVYCSNCYIKTRVSK